MADFDVFGIGVAVRDVTVLLDAFPAPDEKYRAKGFFESSGGPVPTALVTLARLGRRVGFCGVVGDDPVGQFIIDDLSREGVDAWGIVRRKDLPSPTSVILVEGGRRTIFEGWQTDLPLSLKDVFPLEPCRYFLVDARLPEVQTEAARRVRSSGGKVVLDCGHPRKGVEEILELTDVAILSHTYPRAVHGRRYDAAQFLEELHARLPEHGQRIAGLTLGKEGCVIHSAESSTVWIPGHKVEAQDSTGAGDVFHGAFLHALLKDETPEVAARFANAAAALKCRGMTGRAPIPSEQEIRDFAGI
jgi:ribokinase